MGFLPCCTFRVQIIRYSQGIHYHQRLETRGIHLSTSLDMFLDGTLLDVPPGVNPTTTSVAISYRTVERAIRQTSLFMRAENQQRPVRNRRYFYRHSHAFFVGNIVPLHPLVIAMRYPLLLVRIHQWLSRIKGLISRVLHLLESTLYECISHFGLFKGVDQRVIITP